MKLLVLLVSVPLVVASCTPTETLPVHVWGCIGPVLPEPGRACLVEPSGLHLWVGAADARFAWPDSAAGDCPAPRQEGDADAAWAFLPACRAAGTVLVTTPLGAPWQIELLDEAGGVPAQAWRDWLASGEPEGAAALRPGQVDPAWEATRRLVATRLEAGVAFAQSSGPGAAPARARAAAAARALREAEGVTAAHVATARSIALYVRQFSQEAGQAAPPDVAAVLSMPGAGPPGDPSDVRPRYLDLFDGGTEMSSRGRTEEAAARLDEAAAIGAHFPWAPRAQNARSDLALLRLAAGDTPGATLELCRVVDELQAYTAEGRSGSYTGQLRDAAQLCARAGGALPALPDGRDPLEIVRAALRTPDCRTEDDATACLRIAEGLIARASGPGPLDPADPRVEEAAELLTRIQPMMTLPDTYAPEAKAWALAEARLARARGDRAGAEAQLSRVVDAPDGLSPAHLELGWQALLERALLAADAGDDEAALRALDEAEALFQELCLWNTPAMGLEGLQASWQRAVELRVRLLIERGEVSAAWDAARRARRAAVLPGWLARRRWALGENPAWSELVDEWRTLRSERALLAEETDTAALDRAQVLRGELERNRRDAVRLLAGDPEAKVGEEWPLPPGEAGDLRLLWIELADGWLAFAQLGAEPPIVRRLPGGAAPAAEAWLGPFDGLVERATRVIVLPYGARRAADPGALPWRGAPLGTQRPVVVSLDLPPDNRPAPEARAVLLADPTGLVPGAPAAVAQAARWARAQGWQVEEPVLGADSAAALAAHLEGARLFHFHGHATAGLRTRSPWSWLRAELLLSPPGSGETGRDWTVADTLLLPGPGPRWVYLSACESAKGGDGPAEALGLAQAFLAAGADYVVATSSEVPQDAAAQFSERFYAEGGFSVSPGATESSFQRAYAGTTEREPFRLYVR